MVHWDDDDWMADWRISYQVGCLLKDGADVCGLTRLLFYDPEIDKGWWYRYPAGVDPLLAGGSLCYTRRFWMNNRFADVGIGEDTRFIWNERPKKLELLDDNTFYVAITHSANTNPRRPGGRSWAACPKEEIRKIMGKDFAFYEKSTASKERDEVAAGYSRGTSKRAPRRSRIGDKPLVSCIMPTRNRRAFVSQSIRYFLRQDYEAKELLIVDDGADDLSDLVAGHESVRYFRLRKTASVGEKRNFAVKNSNGELIAHWDDDDWFSTNRLAYQVEALLDGGADICGVDAKYFYDLRQDRFWSCAPSLHGRMFFADVLGRSIVYYKELWGDRVHYADASLAEDAAFLRAALVRKAKLIKLQNSGKVIYIRHRDNAWQFECGQFLDPRAWRRIEAPDFLPNDDLAFYQGRQPALGVYGMPVSLTKSELPLVSCITPTCNRPKLLARAVQYFLKQEYPNKELVIIDDGSSRAAETLPEDSRIKLIRLSRNHSIGSKRNLGCEAAAGEIVMCWDDDDWYGRNRLSHQVTPILEGSAEVTGLGNSLFLVLATGQFWECNRELQSCMFFNGIVSGTLAFAKRLWSQGTHFPDSSLAEDAAFLRKLVQRGLRVKQLSNGGTFIYIRHDRNSWNFKPGEFLLRAGWRVVDPPSYLPSEDLGFYRTLALGGDSGQKQDTPAAGNFGSAGVRPNDSRSAHV